MNREPFVSCDWGTSSFRLRWVDPGLAVRAECRDENGSKAIFAAALGIEERAERYEEVLRGGLAQLGVIGPCPLVISGMASSSVGWRELPYLEGALRLDGSNLRYEEIAWRAPECVSRTFLISGVAIHPEMMRGEETEAIGIMSGAEEKECTLILPGTHSKHLRAKSGAITEIATYMTGELFEALTRHSLLKATTDAAAGELTDWRAFEDGVRWAREAGLARGLFRVRTRGVLDKLPKAENTHFLSGLLIGAELMDLPERGSPAVLGGAGKFHPLYSRALTALGKRDWRAAPPEMVERAVIRAHAMFLRRF